MTELNKILFIIALALLLACGSNNSSSSNHNVPNLNSLTGMDWYQRVLETTDLYEINIKDSIPEKFTRYLKSIDSNFRMASEGQPWQAGCSPPMIFDSTKVKTYRDEKTGQLVSTTGYVEIDTPIRKLVYFGQNKKMAALLYMSGGIGVMQHLVLFKIEGGQIIEYWHGSIRGDISNQEEILDKINKGELEEITEYI